MGVDRHRHRRIDSHSGIRVRRRRVEARVRRDSDQSAWFRLSVSLDHVGPLAQNVSDAWADLRRARRTPAPPDACTGPLDAAARSASSAAISWRSSTTTCAHGSTRRLAVCETPERRSSTSNSGALPDISDDVHQRRAARSCGLSRGRSAKRCPRSSRESVGAGWRWARRSRATTTSQAQAIAHCCATAVDDALSKCDALVLPTLPIPPQKIGATTAIVGCREEPLRPLTLRLTQLFNLTGHRRFRCRAGDTQTGCRAGFNRRTAPAHTESCCRSRSAAKRS